jgi:hypothetical protein
VARTPKSPKQRKVSLWLAVKKPSTKKMQGVDILKDLCGVRHYDLDSQELSAVADDFPKATVEEILSKLSYSSHVSRGSHSVGRREIDKARILGTGAV